MLEELGTFRQGVSKQGVMTFAWQPGSQYDVSATRGADNLVVLQQGEDVAFVRQYGCRSDGAERQCTGKQMRIPPLPLPPFKCALKKPLYKCSEVAGTTLTISVVFGFVVFLRLVLLGVSRWSLFWKLYWGH